MHCRLFNFTLFPKAFEKHLQSNVGVGGCSQREKNLPPSKIFYILQLQIYPSLKYNFFALFLQTFFPKNFVYKKVFTSFYSNIFLSAKVYSNLYSLLYM